LIAKRRDEGTIPKVYFRNGFTINANQSASLDSSDDFLDVSFNIVDENDSTAKFKVDVTGTTNTSTTLQTTQTANRILVLPDISDTLVTRTTTDTGANRLQNKDLDDTTTYFVDSSDVTKKLKFDITGSTSTNTTIQTTQTDNRTITLPDATDTLVGRQTDDTQVNRLKNKDLEDSTTALVDATDTTKKIKFNVGGDTATSTTLISTQTADRSINIPDADGTLLLASGTQDIETSGTLVVDYNGPLNAVRITQSGSGNALVVEDSANPDATPFIIDNNGRVSIGNTAYNGNTNLTIDKTLTGNAYTTSVYNKGTIASDVVSSATGYVSDLTTQGTAFNLGFLTHYAVFNGAVTSPSTVTTQYGFYVDNNMKGATYNYGFWAGLSNNTPNTWNFYAESFAPNYFAGKVGIGTATPVSPLEIFSDGSDPAVKIRHVGTGPALLVEDSGPTPESTPFIIDQSGNVGIGNTAPTAKLEVTGDFKVSTNSLVSGVSTINSLRYGDEAAVITSYVLTPATSKVVQRITSADSDLNMVADPTSGKVLILINTTANAITINNDTGGITANRIITGTNTPFSLNTGAAVTLLYDATNSRWRLTGGAGGGKGTTDVVTQTDHGFVTGDVLYLNGSTYTKAIATTAPSSEVVGIVSQVLTSSLFELTLSGEVTGLSASNFTENALPATGEAIFLSAATAGKLTITEPSVIGQVSLPIGVASGSGTLYVMPKRGFTVGAANVRTQIALANNTTTNIQDVSNYDAGEIAGWVFLNGTTDYRFYVQAQFVKGANGNFNISYQTSGDTPPVGFSLSITNGGTIQGTLPSLAGFVEAFINYALNAPAVGATFPLSISGNLVVGGTPQVLGLTAFSSTGLTFTGSINKTYTAVTSATTLNNTHHFVSASGATTYAVTLPTAAGITGRVYIVKSNMNAGVLLTVNTTSSQTIDGVTSKSLARYESLQVISNGSNWEIF
jgi:hypothetical protein